MECNQRISIDASPHNEAFLCFKLGIEFEELILTAGVYCDWDLSAGSHDC